MLHDIYIRLLAMMRPDILFERLYRVPWYRQLLLHWVTDAGIELGQRVLEIGCGTGALTRELLARGIEVEGVDKSHRMIKTARRMDARHRDSYYQADAATMPFETSRFDTVVAASLINVVSDPRPILAEIKRVLRPGGQVSLLFPDTQMSSVRAARFNKAKKIVGFSAAALRAWAQLAPKADTKKLVALLKEYGFEDPVIDRSLEGMITALRASSS